MHSFIHQVLGRRASFTPGSGDRKPEGGHRTGVLDYSKGPLWLEQRRPGRGWKERRLRESGRGHTELG